LIRNKNRPKKIRKKEISSLDSFVGVAKFCTTYSRDNNVLGRTMNVQYSATVSDNRFNMTYIKRLCGSYLSMLWPAAPQGTDI